MATLILELTLPDDPIIMTEGGTLFIDLSNGVVMKTKAPSWVQSVKSAKLVLEMEVLGSPRDADTGPSSVS